MLPVELEPERTQDLYGNDNGIGFFPGENGDETGSPYFTIDFSAYGQEGTVVQTVKTDVLPTTQTGTVITTDAAKKNWIDAIEQLGGTAAGLITAIKSPGVVTTDPNYTAALNLANGAAYAQSVEDSKKNNTVWVIVAIVLVAVLLYLAFKKDK